jgi:hypothetical protein
MVVSQHIATVSAGIELRGHVAWQLSLDFVPSSSTFGYSTGDLAFDSRSSL